MLAARGVDGFSRTMCLPPFSRLLIVILAVAPAVVAVFNDFPVFTRLLHSDHFDADRRRPLTFLAADVFAKIDLVSNPSSFER